MLTATSSVDITMPDVLPSELSTRRMPSTLKPTTQPNRATIRRTQTEAPPLWDPEKGATIVTMSIQSLREVRDRFSEVVDRVEREHERVTVTRNGHAAAVILSPEDLAELEETLEVLSDPEALADIREADAAYRAGDVVRGVDAVRGLRS